MTFFLFEGEGGERKQWREGPTQKAENTGALTTLCKELSKQWALRKEQKKNFQVEALNLAQEKWHWAAACLCTLQRLGLHRKLKVRKNKIKNK